MIFSGALMLRYLGEHATASAWRSVADVIAEGST